MASSSKKSANLLGKRKPGDELGTKPILRKHKVKETKSDDANLISVKETVEGLDETGDFVEEAKKTLFVCNISRKTEISDIISFFKDVAQVVSVRLILNHNKKHVGYGFVDFASAKDAKKALEKKNGQYLHYRKITLDETQDHHEVDVPKKTLFIAHFCRQTTEISDVIDFFEDVGQVVRVRLVVDQLGNLLGCGFVEFASANEANKALQTKKGEYLRYRKIFLDVAYRGATYLPPPKYCIDHKVWYEEDYQNRLDETPDYHNPVVLVANISPQTTKIIHIMHFFKDVGEIVSVRLIVNQEGKHMGYGFVEFASPNQANKALEEKNGEYLHDHKILLIKGFDQTPDFVEAVGNFRKKTVFIKNLSSQTEISDIINFFKDVGEVVHVRLIVDQKCNPVPERCGFVEFASANEANKAVEKKNGEYLHDSEIILKLDIMRISRCVRQPMYCIDHNVGYEDYLGRESLVETPDFSEEAAVRKKTVFVSKHTSYSGSGICITDMMNIFKDVGEVVRVRLIVDQKAEYADSAFVEFATANQAMKAVLERTGFAFFVNVAEIDRPYPFQPKYKLADIAEKLWYEEELLRRSFELDVKPPVIERFSGKKTILSQDN